MLDVISGGRLVAGFPVGLSYDANINQGIPGVETRGRFKEGYEVLRRAWASQEPFAFNGRYSQYANVNMWPRPVQDPHPPLWFPGSGNPGTMDFVLDQDAAFVLLTWFGVKMGGEGIFERFWEMCEAKGKEVNPHRVAVVQVCAVAETDERAEAEYGPWLEKGFRHGLGLHPAAFPPAARLRALQGPPGHAALDRRPRHRRPAQQRDVPRAGRRGLRHRRQPGDGARAPRGGVP